MTFAYDPDEQQLTSITSPLGATTFSYQEPTDQLESIVEPLGEELSFTWDGPLLTSATWTGTVNGSVEWTYDTSFRPQTLAVNGANPVAYSYDQDSLVTGAGALAITRETDTGRESTTTLANVTTTRTYTPFGEPDTFVAQYNGSTIYAEDLDYDDRGWITDIERTQNGGTFDWSFGYDLRGRLETVEIDGSPESTYGYDVNSNRTSYDGQFGTVLPADVTVDARDRLLAYDDLTFTYTDAGELLTKTQAGQTVEYDYDVFGNLRTVDLPGGTEIEYVTDGANRRIGKKIDGTLVQGFLYQDALNPIAELDGSGNVVSRFVYATRANVPDYMVQGGTTYRIISDHLGSVRLVIDVATGVIAQELRYDEFGRVTLDTSLGFQPFGFAGGLYDAQTGLVRFGARDYDPELGRWTAPDPIGFAAQATNLYSYVAGNPQNAVDPFGLEPASGAMAFCLQQTFGETVSGVDVRNKKRLKNQWITTRRDEIRLPPDLSPDEFFEDSGLVLHEYFHVLRQWNTGEISLASYAREYVRNGAGPENKFEAPAYGFADENVEEFDECLAEQQAAAQCQGCCQ